VIFLGFFLDFFFKVFFKIFFLVGSQSGYHPYKEVKKVAIIHRKMSKKWLSSIQRGKNSGDH
jgi:hypothetical protein